MIPGYAPLPSDDSRAVFAQRRRLAVAITVTVIAVLVSLASGGDSGGDSQNSNTPGVPGALGTLGPDGGAGGDAGSSTPADPAFLPSNNDAAAPDIVTVNVPAPPTGTVITGNASFIRWPQTLGLAPCATPHALIGAKITVTNLNNLRSVVCDNVSIESLGGGNTIIIHTDVFLEIADLVDAPIPVEIQF